MRKIIIVICLIVFCGSGYYLLDYVMDNMSAQKTVKKVAEARTRGIDAVYAQNDDLVGWVRIRDTKIDYPVMQTPSDPEYYLHRDFNQEYSESGTLFADSGSVIAGATAGTASTDASTWNWLIYGHHMKFGTMFHDLLKYESKAFWEEHQTFAFDRIVRKDGKVTEADEEYEVIAAAYSQIYPEESNAFKYYDYVSYFDKEHFDAFIRGVKAQAAYDTGVTATYGDQLVTLSTCAYHVEEGRFYIVGKRIERNN